MKSIKFITAGLLVLFLSTTTFAQKKENCKRACSKTVSLKVNGKCDMCKTRIENAAMIEGVSKAEWDKETQLLTVACDTTKVSSSDIQKKIAAAGHDTEQYKADDMAYNNLPACCKYERKQ